MRNKSRKKQNYLCCQQNVESLVGAFRQTEPPTHVPMQLRRGVEGRRGVPLSKQIEVTTAILLLLKKNELTFVID